ncbi:MAG TPA: hypothetical protein VFU00_09870, partial [Gemmatimonadales bacterium]|nr:hypothetical protein [Gemmatimonadales bacterium]
MRLIPWVALAALSAASFVGGGWAARATTGNRPVPAAEAALFRAVMDTILTNHVDEREHEALYDGAARGLLASLDDPYAELLQN